MNISAADVLMGIFGLRRVGVKFKAKMKHGKLDMRRDLISTYLSKFKDGTVLDVEIVRKRETVSDPMRKMYFAAILPPFMKGLGYDPEDEMLFHHHLKATFYRIKPDKHGICVGVPSVFGNKSKIDVKDKTMFVEWVLRKAAQEGIYIDV